MIPKNIWGAFFIAFGAFIFLPSIFFSFKLFYFSPFLVILFYRYSYLACLWCALAIGFIIDLFASHAFLGINALAYTSATALLYNQKRNFFSDKISTLPIMTFVFSCTVTAFLLVISSSFERKIPISATLLVTDFAVMPLFDSFYALAFFVLPSVLLSNGKIGRNIFSSRRKRR